MSTLPVIRIEMPTPFGVGPVNAFLIEAEPLTLVDAGINTREAQNAFKIALTDAGYPMESIERILVTHGHPDHYGLVDVIQEASGANIYFPEKEIRRVRDPQMFFETGRLLVEAGMPLELLFKMDKRRQKEGHRFGMDHDQVLPVHDGDRFAFHDFELVALDMPGHTGGHVVYFEPESRSLFAGDELLPKTSPNPLLEPKLDEPGERRHSLKDYLASLEKMAALEPSIAYPGHGEPITEPLELIRTTAEHHDKRKAEVASYLGAEGQTPYQIAEQMFPDKMDYEAFLAVSEVIAHLDLVVEDGDGKLEDREGVTYYSAPR